MVSANSPAWVGWPRLPKAAGPALIWRPAHHSPRVGCGDGDQRLCVLPSVTLCAGELGVWVAAVQPLPHVVSNVVVLVRTTGGHRDHFLAEMHSLSHISSIPCPIADIRGEIPDTGGEGPGSGPAATSVPAVAASAGKIGHDAVELSPGPGGGSLLQPLAELLQGGEPEGASETAVKPLLRSVACRGVRVTLIGAEDGRSVPGADPGAACPAMQVRPCG
jgi:hypothetical protein